MLHFHRTHRSLRSGVVVGPMIPGRCAVRCCSRHSQASLPCLRNLKPRHPQAAKAEMRQVATCAASGVCVRVFTSLVPSKDAFLKRRFSYPGVALFSCVWSPSYFVVLYAIRSGHDLRGNWNFCCAAAELHLEAPLEIRPPDNYEVALGAGTVAAAKTGVPSAACGAYGTSYIGGGNPSSARLRSRWSIIRWAALIGSGWKLQVAPK